jgi:hypothetical protein
MKIKFGTTDSDEPRALLVGFFMVVVGFACRYLQLFRSWSHHAIVDSRLPNRTSNKLIIPCGFSYADYSCSVLSITPNISQHCLNDAGITGVRLLPLLLFVLELCVIHELFSLSDDCIRFFLYAIAIVSVITVFIYHNSCAQFYITEFLFLMCGILFMLTMRNTFSHNERRRRAAGIG